MRLTRTTMQVTLVLNPTPNKTAEQMIYFKLSHSRPGGWSVASHRPQPLSLGNLQHLHNHNLYPRAECCQFVYSFTGEPETLPEALRLIKKMRADIELLQKEKEEALKSATLRQRLLQELSEKLPSQGTSQQQQTPGRKPFEDLSNLSQCLYSLYYFIPFSRQQAQKGSE